MSWNEEIKKTLAECGSEVFIGEGVKIFNPHLVKLGDRVRIDPYTIITSGLTTGRNVQICAHAILGGGEDNMIHMGDWTFIGYGSQLFCGSEDYSGNHGPVNDFWGHNKVWHGDIIFEDYSGIASQCMVFPKVTLPVGCTVGAQSMVRKSSDLFKWMIHRGSPAKPWRDRNKDRILELANDESFIKNR
tara:strand:- start:150577 stop:151140 length:564 start_codon:yes stop_codon:yes gene_type:complete